MISVTVGTNTSKTVVIVTAEKTPKEVLQQAQVDYSQATVHLDGAILNAGEMNKSLADNGIVGDKCLLIAVIKTDNSL